MTLTLPMSRADLELRLIEIARRIEESRTSIWLCKHERAQLRYEMRRLQHADGKVEVSA
jgi:hypothetical protein